MNNKLYHLFVLFLISAGLISAQVSQVVSDFENPAKGTDGFYVSVGNNVTVFNQKTDTMYGGVLEAQINSVSAITLTMEVDYFNQFWTSSIEGAKFLTIDVFVPEDFPDSSYIQLWEMDHTNWNWKSTFYSPSNLNGGRTMVKGKWNTFIFEIIREYQNDPILYFPWNVRMGLEINILDRWKGSVLIDNVTLWSTPKVIDDFTQDIDGWTNWGEVIPSPIIWNNHAKYGGVVEIPIVNSSNKKLNGGVNLSNINLGWTRTTVSAVLMSLDIYIPDNFPDSSYIQFFNMDQTHWNWKSTIYSPTYLNFGVNTTLLKKGEWNTMAFEVQQQYSVDPINYNPWFQVQAGLEINIPKTYVGTLYIDSLCLYTKDDLLQTDVSTVGNMPLKYNLAQNYPNPFNPTTLIKYQIAEPSRVSLKVYDILGREIATLANEQKVPGNYEATFNGSKLASGVYIYRLIAGNLSQGSGQSFIQTKKLLLLK